MVNTFSVSTADLSRASAADFGAAVLLAVSEQVAAAAATSGDTSSEPSDDTQVAVVVTEGKTMVTDAGNYQLTAADGSLNIAQIAAFTRDLEEASCTGIVGTCDALFVSLSSRRRLQTTTNTSNSAVVNVTREFDFGQSANASTSVENLIASNLEAQGVSVTASTTTTLEATSTVTSQGSFDDTSVVTNSLSEAALTMSLAQKLPTVTLAIGKTVVGPPALPPASPIEPPSPPMAPVSSAPASNPPWAMPSSATTSDASTSLSSEETATSYVLMIIIGFLSLVLLLFGYALVRFRCSMRRMARFMADGGDKDAGGAFPSMRTNKVSDERIVGASSRVNASRGEPRQSRNKSSSNVLVASDVANEIATQTSRPMTADVPTPFGPNSSLTVEFPSTTRREPAALTVPLGSRSADHVLASIITRADDDGWGAGESPATPSEASQNAPWVQSRIDAVPALPSQSSRAMSPRGGSTPISARSTSGLFTMTRSAAAPTLPVVAPLGLPASPRALPLTIAAPDGGSAPGPGGVTAQPMMQTTVRATTSTDAKNPLVKTVTTTTTTKTTTTTTTLGSDGAGSSADAVHPAPSRSLLRDALAPDDESAAAVPHTVLSAVPGSTAARPETPEWAKMLKQQSNDRWEQFQARRGTRPRNVVTAISATNAFMRAAGGGPKTSDQVLPAAPKRPAEGTNDGGM